MFLLFLIIWYYLEGIIVINIMTRRLTKIQKDEIVQAYRGGTRASVLAAKYNCSSTTINRTVKTLLADFEYKLLKGKSLKSSNKNLDAVNLKDTESNKEECDSQKTFNSHQLKVEDDGRKTIKTNNDFYNQELNEVAILPILDISPSESLKNKNSEMEKINHFSEAKLEEIVPLISSFEFEKKELDFEILNQENLPESVYMLVDKKVELEIRAISDLPEWSFLPENELKRNALLLFSNQRSAKRSCSKNQRVIKIPNTKVFDISKSYLFSKGITRLILEDSIIALDNDFLP